MITDIRKASPKTLRTIRYAHEMEKVAFYDCILAAHHTQEFRAYMEERVFSDARFARIPKYRRSEVEGYVRGALDMLAHLQGMPTSELPDFVQPKQRRSTNPPPPAPAPSATFVESSFSSVWPSASTNSIRMAARKITHRVPEC
jgi:hypothetical protein